MYRIACPECSKSLKFKDASRIGSKAKCPKCGHRFLLELPDEPDEVELQLAEPPKPQQAPPPAKQPMVGTSARWVPDESQQPLPAQPPVSQAPVSNFSFVDPSAGAGPIVVAPEDATTSTVGKLQQRRKRKGKSGLVLTICGFLLTAGVGSAAFFWRPAKEQPEQEQVVVNEAWQDEKQDLEAAADAIKEQSPTDGEPIELKCLPPGANIVVHLRPSEIWSDADARREFVFALGPLGQWLETKVRELTMFEPQEIEQLTIAIGLGPRESEPELSALVRLHEEQQRSVLIRQRFKGQRDPAYTDADIFVGEKNAWLLLDAKTFSVGPKELAADLAASASYPADPSDDLRLLMTETDRQRHLTVMFDTSALEIHTSKLFGASLQPAMVQLTDWLGKDVDAAALSLHLGDRMFLETLLRNGTGTTPAKLNRYMRSRVDELPADVLGMVRFMTPRRKGPRDVIARFPAMTKALASATESGIGGRLVQLTTILPERAIPNLAVGTILTWDESTRTDFDRKREPIKPKPSKNLPATLAERLKLKIEIEFKRTPLQEAFAMLGEDTGINFVLDGDGLKLAGYTQNMAQSFDLGMAPAVDGVKGILKQYEKMVLVADESKMTITVTTKDAVEASGAEVYTLP